jgi:cytochrome c oxidase cbb3-type subunit I/II
MAPKDVSPGSIMPAYTWLREDKLDLSLTEKKIRAMQTLGVPYKKGADRKAIGELKIQAKLIAEDIVNTTPKQALIGIDKAALVKDIQEKEIVAVIAYLQRLGVDITLTSKK